MNAFKLLILFTCVVQLGFSTVKGPLKIELLGYDQVNEIVYFSRTNWAECDCETDLYKYHLKTDSIEVIKNWSQRSQFALKRNDILKEKGLDYLMQIDTAMQNFIYELKWLPQTDFYSPKLMEDTVNCPFQIIIENQTYEFVQCFSQEKKPEIVQYSINESLGFLHVSYKGECYEGNTKDEIILIKKSENTIVSKLLIGSKL